MFCSMLLFATDLLMRAGPVRPGWEVHDVLRSEHGVGLVDGGAFTIGALTHRLVGYHGQGLLVECDILVPVHEHSRHEHDDSLQGACDQEIRLFSRRWPPQAKDDKAITKIYKKFMRVSRDLHLFLF